jgi:hypothetical protein
MHNVDPRISQPNTASLREKFLHCLDENKNLIATVVKVAKVATAIIVPLVAFSYLSPAMAFVVSIATGAICLHSFISKCCCSCTESIGEYHRRATVINPNQHQPDFRRADSVFVDPRAYQSRDPTFDERSARFPATYTRPQSPPRAPVGERHHESPHQNRHETFTHPRSAFGDPMSARHVPVGTRTLPSDQQPPIVQGWEARGREEDVAFYPPPPAMRTFPHTLDSAPRAPLGSRAPRDGNPIPPPPIVDEDASRSTTHAGVGSRRHTASS